MQFQRTGHTANLEEPHLFNEAVDRFLAAAERDVWPARDPRSLSPSTTGVPGPHRDHGQYLPHSAPS